MKKMRQWMAMYSVMAALLVMFAGCVPSGSGGGATGKIEAEYAATGPYATTSTSVTGYRIFYPRQMDG
ncbi:MAG: hypothetical protein HZB24_16410, partial [Desulfobacterales bacterium]|nr:hypothetical protein [Desulfobacterales bacterium]